MRAVDQFEASLSAPVCSGQKENVLLVPSCYKNHLVEAKLAAQSNKTHK